MYILLSGNIQRTLNYIGLDLIISCANNLLINSKTQIFNDDHNDDDDDDHRSIKLFTLTNFDTFDHHSLLPSSSTTATSTTTATTSYFDTIPQQYPDFNQINSKQQQKQQQQKMNVFA